MKIVIIYVIQLFLIPVVETGNCGSGLDTFLGDLIFLFALRNRSPIVLSKQHSTP